MATKKSSEENVTVQFKISLDVGLDVGAMSLEDALVKARGMTATDVVSLEGLDHNDSTCKVTSLYQAA